MYLLLTESAKKIGRKSAFNHFSFISIPLPFIKLQSVKTKRQIRSKEAIAFITHHPQQAGIEVFCFCFGANFGVPYFASLLMCQRRHEYFCHVHGRYGDRKAFQNAVLRHQCQALFSFTNTVISQLTSVFVRGTIPK